ncbi:hypothetical protein SS1G_14107 [Sclerotinia sclerotiorum 1980 UF-70]|uniref:Uncharacterized protein n=1 Tax=Sclerotinia sclerotiorum (strain ATCC 18683 / 1980 / Ss-1) TaxID=665079 RepID=A7F926_SCLS1|nr:hypothetical protein SS1G_14107 [Sclerotinia sclerotiorum 1980 UF-70]EDN99247.1 hypothetical protein SS1G_14107 [Sclerotinia sclerotiorum 1980 UF-70]
MNRGLNKDVAKIRRGNQPMPKVRLTALRPGGPTRSADMVARCISCNTTRH